MKPAYARLNILLASEAPLGLVIRHGTAKSVCTMLWDREKDKFTLGQWMRGRIETRLCDLSPDGRHFLYSAQRIDAVRCEIQTWSVVSRAPYLKAVAYYPRSWAGGWFANNQDYCIPGAAPSPDDRESPELRRVEVEPPAISLYSARLIQGGWAVEDPRPRWARFVRPAGAGWELRHHAAGGYQLSRGQATADTSGWDWAEVDGKRLLWTAKGCLWSGAVRSDGVQGIRLLHDFNGMKFAAIAAPYEGGQPVRVKQAPVAAQIRKRARKPVRKKPDRSRVRPYSEDL